MQNDVCGEKAREIEKDTLINYHFQERTQTLMRLNSSFASRSTAVTFCSVMFCEKDNEWNCYKSCKLLTASEFASCGNKHA